MKIDKGRIVLLTSAALVAATGALTPGRVGSQELENDCKGGSKKCDLLVDCVQWVNNDCVKWGEWYWTYQKGKED